MKSKSILIKLVSLAETGYFYITSKNPKNTTEKLRLMKYDPIVGRHVLFRVRLLLSSSFFLVSALHGDQPRPQTHQTGGKAQPQEDPPASSLRASRLSAFSPFLPVP